MNHLSFDIRCPLNGGNQEMGMKLCVNHNMSGTSHRYNTEGNRQNLPGDKPDVVNNADACLQYKDGGE